MNFQYVVASLLNLTQFTENLHVSMCYKHTDAHAISNKVCSVQCPMGLTLIFLT